MECLREYIGIKGYCSFVQPDSGMYLNSLPGIEFANIDEIANAEQQSYFGVWNDIQDRAIERFRQDVIGAISGFDKRYRLREITQSVDLGIDLGINVVPSANKSGVVLEFLSPGDQCICSNMQSFYVQSVKFYCVNAGAFTITLLDADYFTILDTFTVTGVQGWNVIKTDKQYDGVRRISITVDTTTLTTATLDLANFNLGYIGNSNFCSDCTGSTPYLWFSFQCNGTAQVRGIQTSLTNTNPVYGTNTFGVSCVFSVKCTYNNVVCNNKRHFATAFRWLLGVELMTERIYTSRINRWTTVDLKKATELRNEFEIQYRGGEKNGMMLEGALKQVIYGIDLDLSDCCIEADSPIVWRETQM